MNTANYYLSQDGVINRLETYWDKLRSLTQEMDSLTRHISRVLFGSISVSMLFALIIFWLKIDKNLGLILLSLGALGAFTASLMQLATYLEFREKRKRGQVIYQELQREFDLMLIYDEGEGFPVEEKIVLNNFLLASELPITQSLYITLLVFLPILNLGFWAAYYVWAK
ncbi:MAG: hypothetical protein MUE85_24670 [Microscillaceae bacterium]|jgi:hypothetical protein|nr:hypothetical protein [Microscillaceae bacterium]